MRERRRALASNLLEWIGDKGFWEAMLDGKGLTIVGGRI